MIRKTYTTRCGTIVYFTNERMPEKKSLVFLPGLTADHRLFDKQIEVFETRYNVLVWDAPGHAESWPFIFDFTLMDKAKWLDEILQVEGIEQPVLVGQSMGGYVGQAYAEQFPEKLGDYISIDSAPLGREYMTRTEIWMLKHTERMYRLYPWKALLKSGSDGVATTEYGRQLMREMMLVYDGNQKRYAQLAGHGFRMLADAIEANLAYRLPEHSLLICGERDKAGYTVRYNRAWHQKTGIRLEWIQDAGHNSNTDAPEQINVLIEEMLYPALHKIG